MDRKELRKKLKRPVFYNYESYSFEELDAIVQYSVRLEDKIINDAIEIDIINEKLTEATFKIKELEDKLAWFENYMKDNDE